MRPSRPMRASARAACPVAVPLLRSQLATSPAAAQLFPAPIAGLSAGFPGPRYRFMGCDIPYDQFARLVPADLTVRVAVHVSRELVP